MFFDNKYGIPAKNANMPIFVSCAQKNENRFVGIDKVIVIRFQIARKWVK